MPRARLTRERGALSGKGVDRLAHLCQKLWNGKAPGEPDGGDGGGELGAVGGSGSSVPGATGAAGAAEEAAAASAARASASAWAAASASAFSRAARLAARRALRASLACRSRSFCSSTVTIASPDGPERQISESSRLIWFREVIFEKHLETSQK